MRFFIYLKDERRIWRYAWRAAGSAVSIIWSTCQVTTLAKLHCGYAHVERLDDASLKGVVYDIFICILQFLDVTYLCPIQIRRAHFDPR